MTIIFENSGEIDPQLITLIGVNVKSSPSAIGFFGTGLKYAVACCARWGEELEIQSGLNVFRFRTEETEIRGKRFGLIHLIGPRDSLQLSFTTDLGKQWEPWMVYRELWCNAHDEPEARVYEAQAAPEPKAGLTRVIASGPRLAQAHTQRDSFILSPSLVPLVSTPELQIFPGEASSLFYRGIAVQGLTKHSRFTYNILEHLYLTEDRTAPSWATDSVIARGLSEVTSREIIDKTIMAKSEHYESKLDYSSAYSPSSAWAERAREISRIAPLGVPHSIRHKFHPEPKSEQRVCPECGQPLPEDNI